MRTWTRLLPAVLLALLLAASSLRADEQANAKKIEQLQKDVEQLRKDVESLRNDVKNSSARGAKAAEDLQDIKIMLRDMAKKQEARIVQSGYGPASVRPGGAPPGTGTITVRNVYTAPATVSINGRTYRVEAGQTIPIFGVPVGTFQYSVDVEGYGMPEPLRTVTLPAAGYRITIFPRMPL